ncbi:flagellin [Hahella sp. CCB-MM4]|uniref:flagellin N-terminal helical domain-containing protein n=1 Tax=Hahella sp. (strain CCB-MM4) TaxID=1926491 RepID=UPI000B9A7B22|nr:flagellin [Hahella sp. CCB-MM4]OZG73775.1 flagellin [Hahella sp. CCB-MM4]
MPQVINTNLASINAQRNLNANQGAYETALQRLSSGLRINSAKDDAAGLAISTRFTSQTRGLTVAIRNAGDGVSLAQTAEGALGAMTENLLRIRDLALQSANATNSSIDREALNSEVDQLLAEIKRVSDQTNFNGTKLLDGTFTDVTFQIGPNEGESVTFGIEGATVDKLGAADTDGISSDGQSEAEGTAAALQAGDLVINGFAVGASSGVDDAFSSGDQDQSAIAKAAAINDVSDQTGVTAVVNGTFVGGSTSFTTTTQSASITLNGVSINLSISSLLSDQVNLENVVTAINEVSGQTGITADFSGNPDTGVSLAAADGRNIIIQSTSLNTTVFGLPGSDTTAAAASFTYVGTYTLISSDGTDIELDTNTGDIGNAGLSVGTYSGNNSGAIGDEVPATDMVAGDLVINGVPVGPSLDNYDTSSFANRSESAIAKAAAINLVSEQTGVTATANSTLVTAGTITTGSTNSGSITINGVQINISYGSNDSVADKQRTIVTAINNKSGQSGVTAEAFGNTFRLIADDGRNISISNISTFGANQIGLATTQTLAQASIALISAGEIELSTLTGNISNSGFGIGTFGSNETGQLIQDIDISTVDGAILALSAVDNALNTINFQRANLGAIQNRFESTISNQQIAIENLSAANSRIRDADFAEETANLSKAQVLQSAGLSILSQANAQPQQVLQLLQG